MIDVEDDLMPWCKNCIANYKKSPLSYTVIPRPFKIVITPSPKSFLLYHELRIAWDNYCSSIMNDAIYHDIDKCGFSINHKIKSSKKEIDLKYSKEYPLRGQNKI